MGSTQGYQKTVPHAFKVEVHTRLVPKNKKTNKKVNDRKVFFKKILVE